MPSTSIITLSYENYQQIEKLSTDKSLSLGLRKFYKKKAIVLRLYLEGHIDYQNLIERFDIIAKSIKGKTTKSKNDYFAKKNGVDRMERVIERLQYKLINRDK